jgi:Flp pilus assembly protein TadG
MHAYPARLLKAASKRLVSFRLARSGAVAIIFGLAALPAMLLVGMAIDYQHAMAVKSQLQAAVDAGAIAAAKGESSTQATRQVLATNTALANLGTMATQISAVITETESSGTYQVTAKGGVPTAFLKIAKVDSIAIAATASASNTVAGPPTNTICILALSKTRSPGILSNSNFTIDAPTCEIDVASTANPAATFNSGDVFNVSKFCVAGTDILNNLGSIPALNKGCVVASDPFAGKLPAVTVGGCDVTNRDFQGTVTLSPGVYCGNFNFNGSGTLILSQVTDKPYIFKGVRWNVNANWTVDGTAGVTFYFADDSSYIQFNGGPTHLSAPTSGDYKGILVFEPPGLATSSFTINSGGGQTLSGLIYLPSRDITFNSNSNITSDALTLVVNSLTLNNANWKIAAGSSLMSPAGGSGSKSARLVK